MQTLDHNKWNGKHESGHSIVKRISRTQDIMLRRVKVPLNILSWIEMYGITPRL